jgi:2-polyprenyl-3-methyl-5-hydroxy-6-metoxy-1,4-benzoquinol methylase
MPLNARQMVKNGLRRSMPLSVRKQLAVLIARQTWLPQRDWFAVELIRDMADQDITEYHRFLWGNHIGYARTYEINERYGEEQIHPSRLILFNELNAILNGSHEKVRSVLEVGCSMGYLLQYVEKKVYPSAETIHGIDIDQYAIDTGASYLEQQGSRVRLQQADMLQLPHVFGDTRYDLIICAGVLMYVREEEAHSVVSTMLKRSQGIVALAGLAHPERDNSTLESSVPRMSDQSFIHNIDRMVTRAGGRIIGRRWDGARQVNGNTIYFVFAEPGPSPDSMSSAHGE